MTSNKWLEKISIKNRNLYYKLNLIFGLFFLFPVFGVVLFAVKYDILQDEYLPIFFLGLMAFSLFGYTMLRGIFDRIININKNISGEILKQNPLEFSVDQSKTAADELSDIVLAFKSIETHLEHTSKQLGKRTTEISTLKDLSELCYVTFDSEEILYVTLERALTLTNSNIGSILILDDSDRKSFVVKASIGVGELVKVGDRVDFETSIAKYAVINKSPLVVKDIEKDNRFGRANRSHYGTKSFVCMPIKTSRDIIGVLTISRKAGDEFYTAEDVEALIPLLSNAAFTYENLHLIKENELGVQNLKSIDRIFKVINSSLRDSELFHAILNEIHRVVPFDLALVMIKEANRPNSIMVLDLLGNIPMNLHQGAHYAYKDSILDRVLGQGTTLIVDDINTLSHEVEKELFATQGGKASLLAPLGMNGVVRGILVLTGQKPSIFYDTRKLIEWMASALSLAIERNSLSDEVMKRDKELDSIKQIGNALASSTFEINQVIKYTLDIIRVTMDVEAGSILLLDGNELEFATAFDTDIQVLKKFRIKLGQGIAGYVAARGRSLIENDMERSSLFYPELDKVTGFKTRSVLAVPMISQGKVIGVIEVVNKRDSDFDTYDEELLQSIASSLSIALENARLYKETVSMAENERDIRRMFQKFVPKEIMDKILHGTETETLIVEELKTLTILNIDIRDFSELAKKIGPQKTVFMLNHFFSAMGGIIFKHHGIVDKYLGDGFLAIFGAPVSSTMDADNAIAAALEMVETLTRINDFFVKELGMSVVIGISIHTGEMVVGNFGFDLKMDYTVLGDTVNAVFKLQELTKSFPNGIIISENTRRAARFYLEIHEIPASSNIPNILGNMRIYELLGQKRD